MRIEVTQEDIRRGIVFDPCECALGLALERAMGRRVACSQKGWDYDGEFYCHPLPAVAKAFITEFDAHKPVKPFSFDLEIPA